MPWLCLHLARSEITMNLTLKNIPEEIYTRLKSAAEAHRRSLNSAAIVCLEAALLPRRGAGSERLAAARSLRAARDRRRYQRHHLPPTEASASDPAETVITRSQ
jgi:plasmid stability protein